ncbi:ABC transporter permease [Streptomyces sp. NPDC002669]|uniref:ABC transporter permease n=1 Tax=unclassified Streptomyces TaxID=2593676 RepID=UPI00368D4A16
MSSADMLMDTRLLVGRQMRHLKRGPERVVPVIITPLILVLLNGLLIGSAIVVPGDGSYKDFMMAGVFAQVAMLGMSNAQNGLKEDLRNGLVDRFQSLPIARSAAVVARSVAELLMMFVGWLVIAGVGLLIGWRMHEGFLRGMAGIGLMLLFGYLFIWLGILGTVSGRNPQSSGIGSMIVMPMLFLSPAFFPIDNLPGWLQTVCEWNPFSSVVVACRELWGNPNPIVTGAFPVEHPVLVATLLPIALLIPVIPLAVRRYHSVVGR